MKKIVVGLVLFGVFTSLLFGGGDAEVEGSEVDEQEIQIVEEPLIPVAIIDPSSAGLKISVSSGLEFDIGGPVSVTKYLDFNEVSPHTLMSNDKIIALSAPIGYSGDTSFIHNELRIVKQNLMDDDVVGRDPEYRKANKSLETNQPVELLGSENNPVVLNTLFNLDIYGFSSSSDPQGSIDERVQYDLTSRYYSGLRAANDVVQFTFDADALRKSQEERGTFNDIRSRTLNERPILGMYYLEPGNLKDVLPVTVYDAVMQSGLLLQNDLGSWLPIEVLHELGEIYIDQSQRGRTGVVRILIYRWPKDDRIHVG